MSRDLNDPQTLGQAILDAHSMHPEYSVCHIADALYASHGATIQHFLPDVRYELRSENISPGQLAFPSTNGSPPPVPPENGGGST